MPDNKEDRGARDRNRVNINEEYELQHIAEKLGVSTDEVKKAVSEVGENREKVEEYLRGRAKSNH
ncbi:DUF3606 domain-containing protein [Niastella sp. OAS944]|uniref:DUF3606 domain-containing protein n=1 Tax=Niastella sp. OAS944 TaxID=2664089 RepID=UPI00346AE62F|nr:uncharacterized protein YdbL (DUF1318 family) [Chitinophagaceae bacterium OAS944]